VSSWPPAARVRLNPSPLVTSSVFDSSGRLLAPTRVYVGPVRANHWTRSRTG
jgi:hypothetical protein